MFFVFVLFFLKINFLVTSPSRIFFINVYAIVHISASLAYSSLGFLKTNQNALMWNLISKDTSSTLSVLKGQGTLEKEGSKR